MPSGRAGPTDAPSTGSSFPAPDLTASPESPEAPWGVCLGGGQALFWVLVFPGHQQELAVGVSSASQPSWRGRGQGAGGHHGPSLQGTPWDLSSCATCLGNAAVTPSGGKVLCPSLGNPRPLGTRWAHWAVRSAPHPRWVLVMQSVCGTAPLVAPSSSQMGSGRARLVGAEVGGAPGRSRVRPLPPAPWGVCGLWAWDGEGGEPRPL